MHPISGFCTRESQKTLALGIVLGHVQKLLNDAGPRKPAVYMPEKSIYCGNNTISLLIRYYVLTCQCLAFYNRMLTGQKAASIKLFRKFAILAACVASWTSIWELV